MKRFRYVIWAFIFSGIFFPSCNHNDRGTTISNVNHGAFVQLKDAQHIDPAWSKDNVLVVHWLSDPQYLHPVNTSFFNALWILRLTHFTLLTYDQANQQIIPMLVKAMPVISDDYLRFTYDLLEEASWDDGTPITTDDVIFTFKANKCPLTNNPNMKPYLENIKTIIPDSANHKKFTIVMKEKSISNLQMISDYFILSHKFYDSANVLANYSMEQLDDLNLKSDQHPDLVAWANNFNEGKYGNDLSLQFGEGPYKVISWDRDQTITLLRKENNWVQKLEHPNRYLSNFPDKIIFKVIRDENAAKLECESQQIDVSTWLTTQALMSLQNDSAFNHNYNSAFMEMYTSTMIVMNERPDGSHRKKLLVDVNVRKAMAMLVPVDQIIQVIALGKAKRWPSMVSPLKKEFNPDLKLISFDVEGAKKILDKEGWKDTDGNGIRDKIVDGEKIEMSIELIYTISGKSMQQLVNVIAESMKTAGINLILKTTDQSTLRMNAAKHDFDMAFISWSTNSQPEDYTQLWHTRSWSDNGGNYSGFGTAASDQLIDSIKVTIEEQKRISMVKRLQKIVYDDQPCIFMYTPYRKVIVHKRFGNVTLTSELPGVIVNDLKLLSRPKVITQSRK
ncbi:MAG: hypothetical protein H0W62_10515 [Chitinophagales bacterium]|nr:hypothetical protein [Chitinophagales bacterium]